MFENYGQYARDIISAARSMTPKAEIKMGKMVAGAAAAVLVCGASVAGGNAAFAHAEMQTAIESVSSEISDQFVEVMVDDPSDTSIATMLSDSPNNLSAKDEAAISAQIKDAITPEALAAATGSFNSDGLLEIEMKTADGIPVVVQVKKNDDGVYTIDKIIAKLDAAQAETKKQEIASAITSDGQKSEHAKDLAEFADAFDVAAGVAEDADDETRAAAYDKQMVVLADDLIMGLPAGYALQDEGDAIPDDPIPMASASDGNIPEDKLAADSVEPYSYSYKNDSGSVLSVRSENLGVAFTSMNGLDGINKMKGYWSETATSISAGASQVLKDENNGFATEVFYDETSGMWGYFGHVEFTDGTRDVIYNRVVFIDELADQLITVSYRHDCAVDAGTAMTFEAFKNMVMHAPVADVDDAAAVKYYEDKLYQIQILPGQQMTEPKRIAAEEAAKADAEAEDMDVAENVE